MVFSQELNHLYYDDVKFDVGNGRIYPQDAAAREQSSLDKYCIAVTKLGDLHVSDE
jgi:hypothetical protein